jgi:hypothetical protein
MAKKLKKSFIDLGINKKIRIAEQALGEVVTFPSLSSLIRKILYLRESGE